MEDTVFDGAWWRFSAYEIRNGYIRPKPDAKLSRYDPSSDFQLARNERHRSEMPHASLANLASHFNHDMRGHIEPKSKSTLLNWCSEYGLLGLLLHQVHSARFWPRWKERRPPNPERQEETQRKLQLVGQRSEVWRRRLEPPTATKKARRLHLTQQIYQRTASGGFRFGEREHGRPVRTDGRPRLATVAEIESLPAHIVPGVVIYDLWAAESRTEALAINWCRYFPSVPTDKNETYQYPKPYSDRFWRLYAEPFVDLIQAGLLLREAMFEARQHNTSQLNALVSMAGPALLSTGDSFLQRIVSPSLLGSLAVMAQVDLASGKLVRCRNTRCANIVVAFSSQSAYCSPQCRYAQVKRRSRRKARNAS